MESVTENVDQEKPWGGKARSPVEDQDPQMTVTGLMPFTSSDLGFFRCKPGRGEGGSYVAFKEISRKL